MTAKLTQQQLSDLIKQATEKVAVGSRYSHYKQQLIYKVLYLAIREEDNVVCVVYQAEYGDQLIFTRPVANWTEQVEKDGQTVQRFKKIEDWQKAFLTQFHPNSARIV